MAGVNGSICTHVYDQIKDMILSTILKPGDRMVESKVAKELKVSLTPVREAFSLLANQGLLTSIPYCATYVTILTQEDAHELIDVRKNIESLAIELAFPNLKSDDADFLLELCQKADEYTVAGDHKASIECDIAFHEFFFKKSENELLFTIWTMLRPRVEFFQCLTRHSCEALISKLSDRHGQIVEAVRGLDLEGIKAALVEHMNTSMQRSGLPSKADIDYKMRN